MQSIQVNMNLVIWAALFLVTVWRLIPLLSEAGRTPGRIMVFALFFTSLLSNTFELPPVAAAIEGAVPGFGRVPVNLALIAAFFNFIYFFAAQLPHRELFLRTWFQGVLGVLAGITMTTCWAVSPIGVPSYSQLPTHGPGLAPAYLFYVLGSVYFAYACLMVIWLGFRTANLPGITQPWAFRTCAIGTSLVFLGGPLIRTTSILFRWTTEGAVKVPQWIEGIGSTALSVGILGYVVGLCAVGARTLVARTRLSLQLRRDHRRLRALWASLNDAFPTIRFRPAGTLAERLGLRRLRIAYRYRRRVIECRDGLWRLSPYIPDPPDVAADPVPITDQAELVRQGLERVNGEQPVELAEPVAIAASRDDEDRYLVELADAFAKLIHGQPRSGLNDRAESTA